MIIWKFAITTEKMKTQFYLTAGEIPWHAAFSGQLAQWGVSGLKELHF